MREVVAECDNPVLLYSIGKDSVGPAASGAEGVLSGQPAVPAAARRHDLEVPRDDRVPRSRAPRELGLELIVHINQDGLARGIGPFTHGSRLHTDVMKTQALRQALDQHGFDAAFGGARRDEEKSRAKERIFSLRAPQHRWDPKRQRPEPWRLYNTRQAPGRERARVSALQLDRARRLALHRARGTSRSCRSISPPPAGRASATARCIMRDDERLPLQPGETVGDAHGALPHARLLPADRRDRKRRRHAAARSSPRRAAARVPNATAALIDHDGVGLDGAEKAGGLFLMDDPLVLDETRAAPKTMARRRAQRRAAGPAALHHLRFGRRRQVDADRPAALRFAAPARRSAGSAGKDSRQLRHAAATRSISPCWSTALPPSASRASPSMSPIATSRHRSRSFIVADTPGHEQYTRNMATGASTADVAVILVDARKGLTAQTRRHLFIVSMLGIRRVVLAVNKMDLVAFARERFDLIADQCRQIDRPARPRKPRLRSGFGNLGRQHRQRLARDAVVSRTYAAAPARDRPRRRGTHERFVSFPGPVGDAAERGFPRIWRDDRKRFGRRPAPG